MISKQDCMVLLLNLKLTYCSDAFDEISLGTTAIVLHKSAKKGYLSQYKNRDQVFKNMSLHEFYHMKHNQKIPKKISNSTKQNERIEIPENSEQEELSQKRKDKYYIPIYTGACTAPVYPPTKEFAYSIALIYKPWPGNFF